ncbi:MAG: GNAT family N-acetyltransferase [Planctomycetota bacterium]|nr:GNAT family N-acetyltransferase [Planctomycetota bacterium]
MSDPKSVQGRVNSNRDGKSMPEIRLLERRDIPQSLELCRIAGWNQIESDWERILDYGSGGCYGAFDNDHLLGTVTSTKCAGDLAWIGMMLVHPRYRRLGIGRYLLCRCLENLRTTSVKTIKLDATPLGENLYRKIGFRTECGIQRWYREKTDHQHDGKLSSESQTDCLSAEHASLDKLAFGCDRLEWIRHLIPSSRFLSCKDGFCMLRQGHLADYLGPMSARSVETANNLVALAIQQTSNDIFWDILEDNHQAKKIAHQHNFIPVRKLTRMFFNANTVKADPTFLYALADPAVG